MLSLSKPLLPCPRKLRSPERQAASPSVSPVPAPHWKTSALCSLIGGWWFCLEGDPLQEPATQWHPGGVLQNGCGDRVLPTW